MRKTDGGARKTFGSTPPERGQKDDERKAKRLRSASQLLLLLLHIAAHTCADVTLRTTAAVTRRHTSSQKSASLTRKKLARARGRDVDYQYPLRMYVSISCRGTLKRRCRRKKQVRHHGYCSLPFSWPHTQILPASQAGPASWAAKHSPKQRSTLLARLHILTCFLGLKKQRDNIDR